MIFEDFAMDRGKRIVVVGVGGAGNSAVENMQSEGIKGVNYVVINTDSQALEKNKVQARIKIGKHITKGLGAGANPEIGRQAAMEDRNRIENEFCDADMVIIVAGMGGGTGTGGSPIVAQVAKSMGILTVAVVTMPFPFEGSKRTAVAEEGIKELAKNVDSLITIPNEKLLPEIGKQVSLLDAFKAVNYHLLGAVRSITDLITCPGLINVDFFDVRFMMSEMGLARLGTGVAKGVDRAREATKLAVSSPLLENVDLTKARGILVNITAGLDMEIGEFENVGKTIKGFVSPEAAIVSGTVIDLEMQGELRVTVIATGLGEPHYSTDVSLSEGSNSNIRSVKLVASESTSDVELAELIVHLSNVYRSVGGDELIINAVGTSPPDSQSRKATQLSAKRRASR